MTLLLVLLALPLSAPSKRLLYVSDSRSEV